MTPAKRAAQPFGLLKLHRLDNVEVRVIADAEDGIQRMEQLELDVVGRLSVDPRWQHQTITLFVLSDLQPLLRQLEALGRGPADARLLRPEDILSRPVVNVYDLASAATCNVFVNRQAMKAAGYWEDVLSIQGLLAHEHAHPLAECAHTAALRRLRIGARLQLDVGWAGNPARAQDWAERAQRQVHGLMTQLFLTGPREVFTNEIAITAHFDKALVHLNRQNVRNLAAGLVYRPALAAQLAAVVENGQLSQAGAGVLQLIGDLQACLPLAMEIAPFQRAGYDGKADELLKPLVDQVFPQLDPQVKPLFDALVALYQRMQQNATSGEVEASVRYGLKAATKVLAKFAAALDYTVTRVNGE